MKKKYILLVPVGGLANRMKAIDSAIKLSRKTNSELHIIWFKDRGLNCRFDQLFEPIDLPNVKITEATWSDYLLYDRPRQKNIFIPSLFQKATFDNCIYEKQALHLFYENFDFYDWAKNRKVYIASFVYFYSPEDERPLLCFSSSRFHLARNRYPLFPLRNKYSGCPHSPDRQYSIYRTKSYPFIYRAYEKRNRTERRHDILPCLRLRGGPNARL